MAKKAAEEATMEATEISPEKARELLEQAAKKRVEACTKDLDAVLKRHSCRLEPHLVVTSQGNQFGMRVVPVDNQEQKAG